MKKDKGHKIIPQDIFLKDALAERKKRKREKIKKLVIQLFPYAHIHN